METMMSTQAMVPAAFYYNSDPNQENRQQHMHYASHPNMHHHQQQPMHMYPAVPTLASTPIYSRPGSAASQQQMVQAPKAAAAGFAYHGLPSTMTPMASPRPVGQKPTIILETALGGDSEAYPCTPPLSSSSSVISSPGSCDVLQTPLNPMFSGLDGFVGKEMSDVERLESFPNLDWSSCASPPMTPGKPFLTLLPLFDFLFFIFFYFVQFSLTKRAYILGREGCRFQFPSAIRIWIRLAPVDDLDSKKPPQLYQKRRFEVEYCLTVFGWLLRGYNFFQLSGLDSCFPPPFSIVAAKKKPRQPKIIFTRLTKITV